MPPTRYRSHPIEVEACQWTGDNFEEILKWTTQVEEEIVTLTNTLFYYTKPGTMFLWNRTQKSREVLEVGDWVVKDSTGFYLCKEQTFPILYELNTPGEQK